MPQDPQKIETRPVTPALPMDDDRPRPGLLDKLQTGILVTVIAVLVWLYAEGEAVHERPKQIEIQFIADGYGPAMVEPATRQSIRATFQASTGQMAQIERLLGEGPLQIPVAPQQDSAEQVVVMRDALERTRLGDLGVNIRETVPATMAVQVEPLISVPIDVAVEVVERDLVAPRPRVEPSRIEAIVPASLAPYAANQRAAVRLDDVSAFEPNEQHTIDLRVMLPEPLQQHAWARAEPSTVSVTFELRQQTDTVTLTTIPVSVSLSAPLTRRYIVEIPDEHVVVRDIVLTGPARVIDQIRQKERSIRAVVSPTADELDQGVDTFRVELVDVPDSVSIETASLPQVRLDIARRE